VPLLGAAAWADVPRAGAGEASTAAEEQADPAGEAAESPAPRSEVRTSADLWAAVEAVEAAYAQADPAAAREAVAAAPGLVDWEDAGKVARVEAVYEDGRVTVRVTRRAGFHGPLAVVLRPGTYSDPEDDDSQELLLTRAAVIELPKGAASAAVRVDVACGNYALHGPRDGQRYRLAAAPEGPLTALLGAVCAGEEAPADYEVQLAIWALKNGVERDGFREGTPTFRGQPVKAAHAAGAALLLERAGLDPGEVAFFSAE